MGLFLPLCTLDECLVNLLSTCNQRVKLLNCVKNVLKQLVHESAVLSSRYEARRKFGEHSEEVGVALGYSFVLSKLPACSISR